MLERMGRVFSSRKTESVLDFTVGSLYHSPHHTSFKRTALYRGHIAVRDSLSAFGADRESLNTCDQLNNSISFTFLPPRFEISDLCVSSSAEQFLLVANMAPVPADEMDGKCFHLSSYTYHMLSFKTS